MKVYMQWSKGDGSNPSSRTLIVPRLHLFQKLALSQFQLYIEAQTTTQFFVCRNCQKAIRIWAGEGKYIYFCILHMLRNHTGFRNWIKINVFDLHLKKMNPFDICVPCIKVEKIELLFEQYRMDLNRDKYDIEFRNDDVIKNNQTFFDFMQ